MITYDSTSDKVSGNGDGNGRTDGTDGDSLFEMGSLVVVADVGRRVCCRLCSNESDKGSAYSGYGQETREESEANHDDYCKERWINGYVVNECVGIDVTDIQVCGRRVKQKVRDRWPRMKGE